MTEAPGKILTHAPFHHAYLIVICCRETNAILETTIWSSPERRQSRQVDQRVFVAYKVTAYTHQKARDRLLETISDPRCRYNYLLAWFEPAQERAMTCST